MPILFGMSSYSAETRLWRMALCSCVLNGVSMFFLLRTCIVHFCAELHCCAGRQALVGNSVLLHRSWLKGSKVGLRFNQCSQ